MGDLILLGGAGFLLLGSKKRLDPSAPETEKTLLEMVNGAALAQGATPIYALTTTDIESGWKLDATNLGPKDAVLGGSYGPMQITLSTAREQEKLTPSAWTKMDSSLGAKTLLEYPEINLFLACGYLKRCEKSARVVDDVPAKYNAGLGHDHTYSKVQGYVSKWFKAYQKRLNALQGESNV